MKILTTTIVMLLISLMTTNCSFAEEKESVHIDPVAELLDTSKKIEANTSSISNKNNSLDSNYVHSPEIIELLEIIQNQNNLILNLIREQESLNNEVTSLKENSDNSDYSTWVSILLACVAILVTVLGVVIALISFIGYKNFKESTKEAAEKISTTTATSIAKNEVQKQINEVAKTELARLIDEGQLSSHLESAVDVIMRRQDISSGVGGFNKYPELDDIGED